MSIATSEEELVRAVSIAESQLELSRPSLLKVDESDSEADVRASKLFGIGGIPCLVPAGSYETQWEIDMIFRSVVLRRVD